MVHARRVVDVDDATTWPTAVADFVSEWATNLRGTTTSAGYLKIPNSADVELYGLLGGCDVRAYHCARLLDHERAEILSNGMQPLTEALTEERIKRAHEVRAITEANRDLYLQKHLSNRQAFVGHRAQAGAHLAFSSTRRARSRWAGTRRAMRELGWRGARTGVGVRLR